MVNGDQLEVLLEGAQLTVWVSFCAIVWGTVAAVLFGIASLSSFRPLRWFIRVYVEVFRGVAAVILLFWVYYSLPLLGVRLTPFQAGVLALGLNLAAYGTEIVRGALQAVPRGQTEASVALNLSGPRRVWSIILPQAARVMLPPYGNLLIEVMKASSLVSLIGVTDLLQASDTLRQEPGVTALDVLPTVLILYFAISYGLTGLIRLLERRFGRGVDTGRQVGSAPVEMAS